MPAFPTAIWSFIPVLDGAVVGIDVFAGPAVARAVEEQRYDGFWRARDARPHWCVLRFSESDFWILGPRDLKEGIVERRGYPAEFRRKVLDLVQAETAMRASGSVRDRSGRAAGKAFRAGDDVAVVTACAELLAIPLCRAIDPRIHVVGSSLRRRLGGLVAGLHCHGARKVEMLAASGVDGEIVAGYGDNAADGPMLDLARTAVLVNLPEPAAEAMRGQLRGPEDVVFAQWPAPGSRTKGMKS
jgi:hypothetical protein